MSDNSSAQENADQPQPGGWQPCADGELTEFADRVKTRRRLDRINRLATLSLVVLVGGVIAFTAGQHYSSESAQIDCRDVHQHLAPYITGSLQGDLATRIDNHLAYCLGCSAEYHQRTDIAQHARNNTGGYVEAPSVRGQMQQDGTNLLQLHNASKDCTCPDCGHFAARLDEGHKEE